MTKLWIISCNISPPTLNPRWERNEKKNVFISSKDSLISRRRFLSSFFIYSFIILKITNEMEEEKKHFYCCVFYLSTISSASSHCHNVSQHDLCYTTFTRSNSKNNEEKVTFSFREIKMWDILIVEMINSFIFGLTN
jgi:hypothetical protein